MRLTLKKSVPGVSYTTMSGYANGNGWTTQNYGDNTIWIPWTGSGYNADVGTPLPTAGQVVTDTNGNSAVIDHVADNRGSYDTIILYLTTSVPGFASDGSVTIGGSSVATGLRITGGLRISSQSAFGGNITFEEMGPPIIPGHQTEDGTATINGTTGITINNSANTGIGVPNLTSENQTYYSTLTVPNTYTATLGPGSSYATVSVDVVEADSVLVFFIDPTLTYPLTINYPFRIA